MRLGQYRPDEMTRRRIVKTTRVEDRRYLKGKEKDFIFIRHLYFLIEGHPDQ